MEYASYNILEDAELREGIKIFSEWPTIPQVYVKGEFVGGCDILINMHQDGELHDLLVSEGIKSDWVSGCGTGAFFEQYRLSTSDAQRPNVMHLGPMAALIKSLKMRFKWRFAAIKPFKLRVRHGMMWSWIMP